MNTKTSKGFEPDFDNTDGWMEKSEKSLLNIRSNRKKKKGKDLNLKLNKHRSKELEESLQGRRKKLASRFGPRLANLAQV